MNRYSIKVVAERGDLFVRDLKVKNGQLIFVSFTTDKKFAAEIEDLGVFNAAVEAIEQMNGVMCSCTQAHRNNCGTFILEV